MKPLNAYTHPALEKFSRVRAVPFPAIMSSLEFSHFQQLPVQVQSFHFYNPQKIIT